MELKTNKMGSTSFIKNTWHGFTQRFKTMFSNPYREVNLNWFRLKYFKHLPPGKLRRHKLSGKYIYFLSATELLHGLKEIFIDKIYAQKLPPGAVILDCGANIGLSVIYLKEKFPDAIIHAFEPDSQNFELLEKNVSSFNYQNVHLHKEAIWKENTILNFSGEASMSSHIDATDQNGIKVRAVRLRDYLEKPVNFLKIDIEGAEYEVICDIADKLHLVDHLFLEYHGRFDQHNELSQIFSILSAAGFSYYIKEAAPVYLHPLERIKNPALPYDVQLNIFCIKN
jgi:FkbM family methyltransferase